MKNLLTITAAMALAGGFAVTAFAQGDASTEISTAHAHALMAQNATTVSTAHTHLHHVINCLVGPGGSGFDAAAGQPCKGQGNGAIADSAGNQALDARLEKAVAQANTGLQKNDLAVAQQDAAKVAATLQAAPTQKASGGSSW